MLIERALEQLIPVARRDFLVEIDGADLWKHVPDDDSVDEVVHLGDAILPELLEFVALLEHDCVSEVQLRD